MEYNEKDTKKDKLLKINSPSERLDVTQPEQTKKKIFYQVFIFILTFFTYASLHTTREAWAFLKDKIKEEESPGIGLSSDQLGTIDMVFLGFYSIGLYISGVLGDNMNKRLLLGVGYILVSAVSVMIGLGGMWEIRSEWYYHTFFAISGLIQSVGWPSVIAIMANWFPRKGRGFWFGVWLANPNIGNILGTLACNIFNDQIGLDWRWTWIIVSLFVGLLGVLNLLFLVEHPARVGIIIKEDEEGDMQTMIEDERNQDSRMSLVENQDEQEIENAGSSSQSVPTMEGTPRIVDDGHETENSINFFKAWLIPGVIQFSICYLGLKLANYGIMLWLPTYAKEQLDFNDNEKAIVAILYDVGTIAGSVLLGLFSDFLYGKRCPISFVGLLLATGFHTGLIFLTQNEKLLLFIIIFFLGFLVGGISNIISGTACADLGKQDALKNNSKALSTVTGIVDGTGSIGAAIGQKGIGYLQDHGSWTEVFILMTFFVFLSALPLTCIFVRELKEIRVLRKHKQEETRKSVS